MKRAGTDVPILRRWFAGLVYQLGEAATKFHIKDFLNIISIHALGMCQRALRLGLWIALASKI
jgi:hypothetical protein